MFEWFFHRFAGGIAGEQPERTRTEMERTLSGAYDSGALSTLLKKDTRHKTGQASTYYYCIVLHWLLPCSLC